MIDLHRWPTPNGWKVSILLGECGLPYRVLRVDTGKGEHDIYFGNDRVTMVREALKRPAV